MMSNIERTSYNAEPEKKRPGKSAGAKKGEGTWSLQEQMQHAQTEEKAKNIPRKDIDVLGRKEINPSDPLEHESALAEEAERNTAQAAAPKKSQEWTYASRLKESEADAAETKRIRDKILEKPTAAMVQAAAEVLGQDKARQIWDEARALIKSNDKTTSYVVDLASVMRHVDDLEPAQFSRSMAALNERYDIPANYRPQTRRMEAAGAKAPHDTERLNEQARLMKETLAEEAEIAAAMKASKSKSKVEKAAPVVAETAEKQADVSPADVKAWKDSLKAKNDELHAELATLMAQPETATRKKLIAGLNEEIQKSERDLARVSQYDSLGGELAAEAGTYEFRVQKLVDQMAELAAVIEEQNDGKTPEQLVASGAGSVLSRARRWLGKVSGTETALDQWIKLDKERDEILKLLEDYRATHKYTMGVRTPARMPSKKEMQREEADREERLAKEEARNAESVGMSVEAYEKKMGMSNLSEASDESRKLAAEAMAKLPDAAGLNAAFDNKFESADEANLMLVKAEEYLTDLQIGKESQAKRFEQLMRANGLENNRSVQRLMKLGESIRALRSDENSASLEALQELPEGVRLFSAVLEKTKDRNAAGLFLQQAQSYLTMAESGILSENFEKRVSTLGIAEDPAIEDLMAKAKESVAVYEARNKKEVTPAVAEVAVERKAVVHGRRAVEAAKAGGFVKEAIQAEEEAPVKEDATTILDKKRALAAATNNASIRNTRIRHNAPIAEKTIEEEAPATLREAEAPATLREAAPARRTMMNRENLLNAVKGGGFTREAARMMEEAPEEMPAAAMEAAVEAVVEKDSVKEKVAMYDDMSEYAIRQWTNPPPTSAHYSSLAHELSTLADTILAEEGKDATSPELAKFVYGLRTQSHQYRERAHKLAKIEGSRKLEVGVAPQETWRDLLDKNARFQAWDAKNKGLVAPASIETPAQVEAAENEAWLDLPNLEEMEALEASAALEERMRGYEAEFANILNRPRNSDSELKSWETMLSEIEPLLSKIEKAESPSPDDLSAVGSLARKLRAFISTGREEVAQLKAAEEANAKEEQSSREKQKKMDALTNFLLRERYKNAEGAPNMLNEIRDTADAAMRGNKEAIAELSKTIGVSFDEFTRNDFVKASNQFRGAANLQDERFRKEAQSKASKETPAEAPVEAASEAAPEAAPEAPPVVRAPESSTIGAMVEESNPRNLPPSKKKGKKVEKKKAKGNGANAS